MLAQAEKLGIKHQEIYKYDNFIYHKLIYKNKFEYVLNANLGRNINKFSTNIGANKDLTKIILNEAGISVPAGIIANTFEEAGEKIKKDDLELPLVIKPYNLSLGKGVFANLSNWAELKTAYVNYQKIKKLKKTNFVVEEFIKGRDYRILILNGKYLGCVERAYPEIKGDGKTSVRNLIKKQLKTAGPHALLVDWEVKRNLKKGKLTFSNIIEKGRIIRLRENANAYTGGLCINRTKEVYPKFINIAKKCARVMRYELIGVDIMIQDISDPKAKYGVIEVNSTPDYFLHDNPDIGKSENVTQALLKYIFKIK